MARRVGTSKATAKKTEEVQVEEITEVGTESEAIVTEEVKVEKPKVEAKKQPRVRKTLPPNQLVRVRNVTDGGLTYISSRTGVVIRWEEPNEEVDIEIQELKTMQTAHRSFINTPWVIIDEEEEEAIEYLGLKAFYDRLVLPEEVEDLLLYTAPDVVEQRLKTIPQGGKKVIREKAIGLARNNQLYDLRIIKILERELQVDLKSFE